MPRDTAGNYTLPAGNPVASGEIIAASWANSTMNDLGQSLSASLDRYGRGGMLAPFQFTDGTESAPGATWSNEPTTGLYRAAYGDLRFTLTGTDVQRWTNANSYLWRNNQWEEIITSSGGGGSTTINDLVVTGSFTSPGIDDNATSTAITIDASQNVGVGTDVPDGKLTVFSGSAGSVTADADADELVLENSGNVGLSLLTASTGESSIYFGNPGANGQKDFSLKYYHESHPDTAKRRSLTFNSPSKQLMCVKNSGNVGIGTDNPATLLSVSGDRGNGDVGQIARFTNTNTSSGTAKTLTIGTDNYFASNPGMTITAEGGLSFGVGDGSDLAAQRDLTIDASGTTTVKGGFLAAQPGAGTGAFAAGLSAAATGQSTYAVAVGPYTGNSAQGANSVAVGNTAGYASQGASAVAIGLNAGSTTQGTSAVAVGNLAGQTDQGEYSVAIGWSAGLDTQADRAVAIGISSGKTNQGASAVGVGYEAALTGQGTNAVAVGNGAGKLTQGDYSVAVGGVAGNNTQGSYSVALGYAAGAINQTSGCVALGNSAGYTGQQSNAIAIGNSAGVTDQGANGIIINSRGSTVNQTGAGHIHITSGVGKDLHYNGTDTWTFNGGAVTIPNDYLSVGSNILATGSVYGQNGQTPGNAPSFWSSWNGPSTGSRVPVLWSRSNGNAAVVQMNTRGTNVEFGNGGILDTTPAATLDTQTGNLTITGVYSPSDERLKENIVDAPAGNLDDLRVRSYDWKNDGSSVTHGFIAQELEAVAPYAVNKGETEDDMWAVDYTKLVPMLVKEIQDLKAEVAALKGA